MEIPKIEEKKKNYLNQTRLAYIIRYTDKLDNLVNSMRLLRELLKRK